VRIAMVLPSLIRAGMEMMTTELAIELTGRGHSVSVTCTEDLGPLEERLARNGIEVHLVPVPGLRPNLFTRVLRAHFRALRPDVLHSHSGAWWKATLPARLGGVKGAVHTIHGFDRAARMRDRVMMRAGAMVTHRVCAVSEQLATYLCAEVGLSPEKVRTITNGVDHRHFVPGRPMTGVRSRLQLGADAVVLGVAARLVPVKDHATLIDAMALVARRYSRTHLAIAGEGPLREELEQRVRKHGLEGRVHFLDMVADPKPFYGDLDVFVLSSVAEGTSISILEAMSSGLPVVATRVGGNERLVADGVTGLLVPSSNAEAMAAAVSRVVEDHHLRQSFGRAARRRVVEEFSLVQMADQYEETYRAVARHA